MYKECKRTYEVRNYEQRRVTIFQVGALVITSKTELEIKAYPG